MATRQRFNPRPAPRSPHRSNRTLARTAPGSWQVRSFAGRPLAAVGRPVRLALTLSFAGYALAGAAWRAGWRS